MLIRSSLTVAVCLALVSITAGVCCPPAMGSDREMPMEHGDSHQDHSSSGSCCSAHDAQVRADGVVLAPPGAADLVFESRARILIAADQRRIQTRTPAWPPGMRDLTSTLCTLII